MKIQLDPETCILNSTDVCSSLFHTLPGGIFFLATHSCQYSDRVQLIFFIASDGNFVLIKTTSVEFVQQSTLKR